jgi:hypothetical protein
MNPVDRYSQSSVISPFDEVRLSQPGLASALSSRGMPLLISESPPTAIYRPTIPEAPLSHTPSVAGLVGSPTISISTQWRSINLFNLSDVTESAKHSDGQSNKPDGLTTPTFPDGDLQPEADSMTIAIVVSVIVLLALIALMVFCIVRRKKYHTQAQLDFETEASPEGFEVDQEEVSECATGLDTFGNFVEEASELYAVSPEPWL